MGPASTVWFALESIRILCQTNPSIPGIDVWDVKCFITDGRMKARLVF